MLQSEFKERTGIDVALDEYRAIEVVYINSKKNRENIENLFLQYSINLIEKSTREVLIFAIFRQLGNFYQIKNSPFLRNLT